MSTNAFEIAICNGFRTDSYELSHEDNAKLNRKHGWFHFVREGRTLHPTWWGESGDEYRANPIPISATTGGTTYQIEIRRNGAWLPVFFTNLPVGFGTEAELTEWVCYGHITDYDGDMYDEEHGYQRYYQ